MRGTGFWKGIGAWGESFGKFPQSALKARPHGNRILVKGTPFGFVSRKIILKSTVENSSKIAHIFLGKKVLLCKAVTFYCTKIFTVFRVHQIPRKAYKSDQSGKMLCALKFYTDTRCVEMARRQESRQTGAEIHTREVHMGNIARR